MGDIAEMHLDGTLCEYCGEFIDGESPGYPRYCEECKKDKDKDKDKVKVKIAKRKYKNSL